MRQSRHPQIRKLLLATPDGMTAPEIAEALGINNKEISQTMHAMPDSYIDRWQPPARGKRGRSAAVWCVVVVPEDCPKPEPRGKRGTPRA